MWSISLGRPSCWAQDDRGRPLGLFQPGAGARPPLELMAMLRAFLAGMLSARRATWPKKAEWRRWISWLMGGRHVLWVTSLLLTKWNHWMPRIDRWHLMWNDSSRLRSDLRRVHVSEPYNKTGMTQVLYMASLVVSFQLPDSAQTVHGRWG